MTTETLTTILVFLLITNFLIWIFFLLFVFIQVHKILKKINEALDNANKFSNSIFGSFVKFGAIALGLIRGFNSVRSITTLSDIFEDARQEDKNVKKRK